jgi:hypothetical protein
MSRKRREQQQQEQERALDEFATLVGMCADSPGGLVPIVQPKSAAMEQMEFDRRVCTAGITQFVRPVLPGPEEGEQAAAGAEAGNAVYVEEVRPGVRLKIGVHIAELDGTDLGPTKHRSRSDV